VAIARASASAPASLAPGLRRTASGASSGQTLIEFALTFILLLTLIFGIVDGGRAMYAYNAIASAAREGARFGAVHPSGDIVGAVQAAAVGLALGAGDITVAPIDADTLTIEVTVMYEFDAVTPFVPDMTFQSTAHQYREVWE